MFSGIIKEVGILEERRRNIFKFYAPKIIEELQEGSSVAVNGCCLTITKLQKDSFYVFIMDFTLKNTNLGLLKCREEVNLEPALRLGAHVGGHILHGRIDTTGKLTQIITLKDKSKRIKVSFPPKFKDNLKDKDYIGVEGVSLTIAKKNTNSIFIFLTPYTLENSTLGKKKIGAILNIEF